MEKVLRRVKEIAEKYNLSFEKHMFRVNLIDKNDYWPMMFLEGDPIHWIGLGVPKNPIKSRPRQLNKFLSKNFKNFKKYAGGCVTSKRNLLKIIGKVSDEKVKIRLYKIAKNLKSANDRVIVVTKPTNRIERGGLSYILLHELLHMLLISNKVNLQKIRPDYWKLDEAIVNYLMYENFFDKNYRRWTLWQMKR